MTDNGHLSTLSVLIHGESKHGKSTLACTAPPPLVVFDAEGSTKFLPMRVKRWDPLREAPPSYDGTWDAANVIVHDYDTLDQGLQWLESGQHQFRSVVLDSITEIQRKLKDKIAGVGEMNFDHWDNLLRRMDGLLRRFRDLTQHYSNPFLMAVFTAETKMIDGQYRPSMQGQIKDAIPYLFDIVGCLQAMQYRNADGSPALSESGEPFEYRQLLTRPTNPLYYAGQRVQARVPAIVVGTPVSVPPASMAESTPNLTTMLLQVFPHLGSPTS